MTIQGLNFPEIKNKLLIHILYPSNFTYRYIYCREVPAHVHKEARDKKVPVHFSTVYNRANLKTNYPSTEECKSTLKNIYTMEYYTLVKKK